MIPRTGNKRPGELLMFVKDIVVVTDGTRTPFVGGDTTAASCEPPDLPSTAACLTRHLAESALGVHLTDLERQILAHRTGWTGRALTQADLADLVGTNQSEVSKAELNLKKKLSKAIENQEWEVDNLHQALHAASITISGALEQMQQATRP